MRNEQLEQLYRKAVADTVEAVGPVYVTFDTEGRTTLADQHGATVGGYFPGGSKQYDAWAYPLRGIPVVNSPVGQDVAVIPAGHHDTADEAEAAAVREYAAERVDFWAGEGRTESLECDGCGRAMYYSYVLEDYVHAEANPTCGLAR